MTDFENTIAGEEREECGIIDQTVGTPEMEQMVKQIRSGATTLKQMIGELLDYPMGNSKCDKIEIIQRKDL